MKKTKQALALLLVTVMVPGMLPASTIANAAFACTAAVKDVFKDDVAGVAYGNRPYDGIFDDAFAYKAITDENGDNEVGMVDALLVLRYLSGWDITVEEGACDIDGDGEVGMVDALLILRHLSGWDIPYFD